MLGTGTEYVCSIIIKKIFFLCNLCFFVALQKKFSAYSRMHDFADLPAHCVQSKQAEKPRTETELERDNDEQNGEEEGRSKDSQPAETEYLSSRCVLFTYFRGDIGDVVDEHFSRALSQPSAFSNDSKSIRLPSGGPWKGKWSQDNNFIIKFHGHLGSRYK